MSTCFLFKILLSCTAPCPGVGAVRDVGGLRQGGARDNLGRSLPQSLFCLVTETSAKSSVQSEIWKFAEQTFEEGGHGGSPSLCSFAAR